MNSRITAKVFMNKKNGQFNCSLKKKELPKRLIKDMVNVKQLDFIITGWKK